MQEEAAPARPPLGVALPGRDAPGPGQLVHALEVARLVRVDATMDEQPLGSRHLVDDAADLVGLLNGQELFLPARGNEGRSEEHTSELQSLMRTSYAVFCLKKKKMTQIRQHSDTKHTRTDIEND